MWTRSGGRSGTRFKARLEHWLVNVPTKEVTVEQLFYDGYGAGEE